MFNRYLNAWLRPACALLGIIGILALSACGGGNGAPNNPYAPPPPVIPPPSLLPQAITVYPGTPETLTISGGLAPFRVFSSNPSALPVVSITGSDSLVLAASNITTSTTVSITVQDSLGVVSAPASVIVVPAPLLPTGITVTANPNPACASTTNTVCSGGTGTATVKVSGNTGIGIPGRAVRWEVVQGPFSIVSTNPAQPLVNTLTVSTDTNGNAIVVLSVPADTPTTSGVIRATDMTSGNQVTGNFVIQQVTIGGEVLSVLPQGNTTINGPDNQHCSSGVSVSYFIFGGTPPYVVTTQFPQAVTISGVPVTKSGGGYTVTTNGACFINLTFTITDATGRTIPPGQYPTVTNQLGTNDPTPPPPTQLIVTPGAIAKSNCVPANTFQFIGTGGTAPYSAVVTSSTSATTPVLAPQTNISAGAAVTVSNLTSPSTTTIQLFDNSSPRQSGTVTIDCSGSGVPPVASALVVAPNNYNYSSSTCVNKTSNFVVTGGMPPYTVFFASGGAGATITPTTLTASGQGFTVTGLKDTALTTNITVVDSGSPQLQQVVTVTCPTGQSSPAMTVEPASGYTYSAANADPALRCGTQTNVSNFVVTGGTPPYTVAFAQAGAIGVITPTTVLASGQGFAVTGLSPVSQVNQITIKDSSTTQQVLVRTITCTP
jgi:hypothetical protein